MFSMSRSMRGISSKQKEVDPTFEVDKIQIDEDINENGKYDEDGVVFRPWENEEKPDYYLGSITKNNSSFLGVFNEKFERNGYGLSVYENGDEYFGYFEGDKRNKNGIYLWPQEKRNGLIYNEMYYGYWKDNKRDRNGIYLWINEPTGNDQFENANFDAYVGLIENDTFKKGTYLSKNGDDYYLYHGLFDNELKKTDDNAFYYSSKYDRLLHGKIKKDVFISGYVAFFNPESGMLEDIIFCNQGKGGSISNIMLKDELMKNDKDFAKEEKTITTFRNVILEEDYFGDIYAQYKDIKNFMTAEMNSLDVFDDGERYEDIINICAGYNEHNIFNDIEKKAFGKNASRDYN